MIRVNSRVDINRRVLRNITEAHVKALEKTAEALHTDIIQAQVMPRDTGALQGEKTFVDYSDVSCGHAAIVSEGPYARRLYYHPEYHFSKEENPNAKGEWFEDYLPGGKKEGFARKAFQEFFRRESGI